MPLRSQPQRQIHLDFHTGAQIPDVAARFDANAFGDALLQARVQSVQLFARCWHGHIYYQSEAFPEHVHPQLNGRDLLREQISACHARGIYAPIYVALQNDRFNSERRPEWVQRLPDTRAAYSKGAFQPELGPPLCLKSPFRDWMFAHVDEILATMPVDGFWFDGAGPQNCCCRYCVNAMLQRDLDPQSEVARREFGLEIVADFCAQLSERARQTHPDATLFYNAGHIGPRHALPTWRESHTHLEIESLPSGGWGYLHFPVAARLARTFGLQIVGMTGKFHTSWGDFGSYRNRAALEYECFAMLSQGAQVSVGDQLHPDGALDPHTYALIGEVFEQVEAVEPWCDGARPLAEIAILSSETLLQNEWETLLPPSLLGATRMLQELGMQFDILAPATGNLDFSPHQLLVLPDDIFVDDALAEQLREFLARGGAILSSGESGLTPDKRDFALQSWPVSRREPNRDSDGNTFSVDYLFPEADFAPDLARTEHVMYRAATGVEAQPESDVLARVRLPYFERTWKHFCSHLHTPSSGQDGGAAIVRRGNIVHFAHPVFSIYRDKAPRACKTLVHGALQRLLPQPLVSHYGPSTLLATLHEQRAQNRFVLHLLHYIAERRAPELDIMEEALLLHDLNVRLRVESKVARVLLVPQMQPLAFEQSANVSFCVPRMNGHQLVSVELE